MGNLTTWFRARGARPAQRRAARAVPALFGGGRRASSFVDRVDWAAPSAGENGWYEQVGIGDLVTDASTLPWGQARNYGSPAVEQWRSLIEQNAGDLPVEFLMAWIAVESGGNPCDKETSTGSDEVAIFQLMAPDNIARSGYTEAQLYPVPPCGSGAVGVSQLSSEQASAQVLSGINYVNYCRSYVKAKLAQYGYGWDESEMGFWILVKWVHIAPAKIGTILQTGLDSNGGTAPSSYTDMASAVASAGLPPSWVTNGQVVGQYGQGGGSILGPLRDPGTLLAIGVFAIGLYFVWKKVG